MTQPSILIRDATRSSWNGSRHARIYFNNFFFLHKREVHRKNDGRSRDSIRVSTTSQEKCTVSMLEVGEGGMQQQADEHADRRCPVPHAKNTPLPPGHPEVPNAIPSKLKPPSGEHCIFLRQSDDSQAPEADPSRPVVLPPNMTNVQDSYYALVLSSRKSELAVRQATQVQMLLDTRYGRASPVFAPGADQWPSTEVANIRAFLRTFSPDQKDVRPVDFPVRTMATLGDQNLKSPLYVIGGEGRAIWTKELEVALMAGGVDAIVHSLKDVPTTMPDGVELAAILEREDPRDALVVKENLPYKSLQEMPQGSVIGTSSVRRVSLLRRAYPHLMFSDVRGNINTRLAKLDAADGPYTALVLAAAGLKRMDLEHRITAYVSEPVMLHAVGQGSLAIEVRTPRGESAERDERIRRMIRSISNWRATWRCVAERALMHRMEGGCSIPLGVSTRFEDHADIEGLLNERIETPSEMASAGISRPDIRIAHEPPPQGSFLTMAAVIVSLDGTRMCKHSHTQLCRSEKDAEQLGILVAEELEHHQNARAILAEVEHHRHLAEVADEKRRAAQKAGEAVDSQVKEVDRRGLPRDDGVAKAWEV